MLNNLNINPDLSKEEKIQIVSEYAQKISDDIFKNIFNELELSNYKYDSLMVAGQLGLDEELVEQLIEDYITQIFKADSIFTSLILNIHKVDCVDKQTKLAELQNLAHKNLGVVRNLRIKDAQVLLNDLMKKHDDLNHLEDCVEALQACAFKLNPEYAYNTLLLMKLKSTF